MEKLKIDKETAKKFYPTAIAEFTELYNESQNIY